MGGCDHPRRALARRRVADRGRVSGGHPDTTLVAVVSPNNPTGQVIEGDALRRLSAALPGVLLLVDLAYVEFADEDLTALVAELPNAVAFRTLSRPGGWPGSASGTPSGLPRRSRR